MDFSLRPYYIECLRLQLELGAGEFSVDEVHQFRGAGNQASRSAVYAISSNKGVKGVLVDMRGTCADSVTPEMALKLRIDELH